jgi:hypothetical protein
MSPGLPMMPGSQPSAPPNVGSLLGPQTQAAPAMDPNAAGQGVMEQVRTLTAGMDALAAQYPDIASQMQQAKQIVVGAMVRIVASQPAPESPAPAVLG